MLRHMLTALLAVSVLLTGTAFSAEDNVKFDGTLVAEPCVIPPGEEAIILDFGSVINKDLYANQRTRSQPFSIHLTECDPAVAKTVSVTFSGMESEKLPGLLALDAGSEAKGIAIGLETDKGVAQTLNQASPVVDLVSGENLLNWRAYVQGEPDALENKSLTPGGFTATATFALDYE